MSVRQANIAAATCLTLLLAATAFAQDVGRVEEVSGEVALVRAGGSEAAETGATVRMGDRISAGEPGEARIVFVDGTVLTVSPGTEIQINEMVYEPTSGAYSSSFGLLSGEVRTLVGEGYNDDGSTFELQSPTARADLGASDLLMSYTIDTETTEIVTFSGSVKVSSIIDLVERTRVLKPGHTLSVSKTRPITDPRPLARREFGQYLEGIDVSITLAQGLAMGGELLGFASVATEAPSTSGGSAGSSRDAGDLLDGSPLVNHTASIGIEF